MCHIITLYSFSVEVLCLTEVLSNICLGAIGSILATAILFFLSRWYKFNYKEDIYFNLDLAETAIYQIQNMHLYPEDYVLVINQIDVLYQCIFNIYKSIPTLSFLFRRKEKKLLMSLLYDIVRVCELSKYITIGYNGLTEKEERLKKIHKYFYKCNCFDEYNVSTVKIQLDVIRYLIKGQSNAKALRNAFKCNYNVTDNLWKDFRSSFIEINSFKSSDKYTIKCKGLTDKEFISIVEKAKEKSEKK